MWNLPSPGPAELVGGLAALERYEPGRFFAGPAEASTAALCARLTPQACDLALAAAERVTLGRFDLLGRRGLSFGEPIDWQLDPVSGRRSPLVHWSRIDPTDAAAVGDSKLIWELSRQQFLVTLGVAYRVSGDERYAIAFAGLVRAWLRANPAGLGINWASSLEAALRIVSWSWALSLFESSPELGPALRAELHAGLGAGAAHIERYLSRHFSPNTHLTGEALGLFYAGLVCPEGKASARWRRLGQDILEEQIQRQVLADGVYFEQSTAYQRYTVEIYLHYAMLAARNGVAVSSAVAESVQRMLDVLLALRRPDGGLPAIGDADGGTLLPLVPRSSDDVRGLFSVAAAWFGRPEYVWAAQGLQPEALWLLGPSALSAFESSAGAPPREGSRVFPDGGYVVMRSGWDVDAHHLVFDAGPLGCPLSAAHGHADLLSVQVSPFGAACIVDPGTYAYASDPAFREHFRSTRAHSTVAVDGQGQAEPAGPFGWRQRPSARLHSFRSTPAFDLADASHEAYRRLADPVVHRRRVAFVKSPGYWVLADDLDGKLEHGVELRFQLAPLNVSAAGAGWVRAVGEGGRGLLVKAFASQPLRLRVELGSTWPTEGWVSPCYGRREPAPILIYGVTARLPLRILTLLLPVDAADAEPPAVEALLDQEGTTVGLTFPESGATLRFEADGFTCEGARACRA